MKKIISHVLGIRRKKLNSLLRNGGSKTHPALLNTEYIPFFVREIADDDSSGSGDGDRFEPEDEDDGEIYIAPDEFQFYRIIESNLADSSFEHGSQFTEDMKREMFAMDTGLKIAKECHLKSIFWIHARKNHLSDKIK